MPASEPKGSHFLTGWTLSILALALAMIGFGYFKGMYNANIRVSLYDVVRPERRATAVGLMNAIGWLGGGARGVGDWRCRAGLRNERVLERELAGLSVRRVIDGFRHLGVDARAGDEAWRGREGLGPANRKPTHLGRTGEAAETKGIGI